MLLILGKGERTDILNKLSVEKMQEIEKKVQRLLPEFDVEDSPYVDIVSIVKKDGFVVHPEEMDMDTTGYLLVNDGAKKNKRIICVNIKFKNPENERDVVFKKSRFITAHEYGHFILHREEGQPLYVHRDTDRRTEPIELEADYFARAILMPLDRFKLYCDISEEFGKGDQKFKEEILSKIFKVTRNKIRMRETDLVILDQ